MPVHVAESADILGLHVHYTTSTRPSHLLLPVPPAIRPRILHLDPAHHVVCLQHPHTGSV